MFQLLRRCAAFLSLSLCAASAVGGDIRGELASADRQLRPVGAHLTLGEALRIADVAFFHKNPKLVGGLEASEFLYRCEKESECHWIFEYLGKPWKTAEGQTAMFSMTGEVIVDDRTRQANAWLP
jgi:hypothetical protein